MNYYLFMNFLESEPTIKKYFYEFGDIKYRDGVLSGFLLGLLFSVSMIAFKRYLEIPSLI